MGWRPRDYYEAAPYEVFASVEGYVAKLNREVSNQRFAAYRIHQSMVEKPLSIEKFWPLPTDAETEDSDVVVMTPEMLKQIKESHGLR